jgi:ketosteroid isomerase-like protein
VTSEEGTVATSNKEIIEKVNAAFAENSVEGFLSFCADDVEWTMVGDRTVKGKDAIRSWMGSIPSSEPPKFTVQNMIAEGDYVIAYGDMTMKEEGKTTPYSYCDVYRLRANTITELRSFVVKTVSEAASGSAEVAPV